MSQIIQAAAMAIGVAALITGLHLFYRQMEKRSEIQNRNMVWVDGKDKSLSTEPHAHTPEYSRIVSCPNCKAYDVHESRWGGALERLAFTSILHRPARCYTCYKRFYVLRSSALQPRETFISPREGSAA